MQPRSLRYTRPNFRTSNGSALLSSRDNQVSQQLYGLSQMGVMNGSPSVDPLYFSADGLANCSLADATQLPFDWLTQTYDFLVEATVDYGGLPQVAYSRGGSQNIIDTGNGIRLAPGMCLRIGVTTPSDEGGGTIVLTMQKATPAAQILLSYNWAL